MSSFIEFQALVMSKLCSIENRLDSIESVLGIESANKEDISCETENKEDTNNNDRFKSEINDFQSELADLKSIFKTSKN